jgi:type I restriction enzyme S subunit
VIWRTVSLGEVANVGAGNSAPQEDHLFENGIYNFYRTSDVGRIRTGVISESSDKLNSEGIKGLKLHPVGTILFPKSGASTFLNHRVMLGKEGFVSSHLATIKAKADAADDKYLLYFLSTIDAKNLVQDSSYPSLKTSVIEKIVFLLPPLPIQKKIVVKLDAIFAEIDKAIAAAEANSKNAEALFQSYLRQVFEQDSEGWKKIYLKDIAEYFNGLTYSPKNVCENGTIVLRSSNIQKDKIDLDDIVRVDSAIKDKLYVKSGDILMCSRNGSQRLIGKTATIDDLNERMTFGTFMMIIRSDNNFFLKWFFKSDLFKHQITSGENTMINQITRYMLDKIVLSLPDVSIQKLISNKISNLYINSQKLKLNYISKINEFSLIKQSILKKAFNGELVKAA